MPEILFFPYFGPNRHSDRRVVEIRLDFSGDDETDFLARVTDTRQLLVESGILSREEQFPQQAQAPGEDRISGYSSLLVQTALVFQHKNGHRVDYFSVSCDLQKKRSIALMEHENSEVGMAAVNLAIKVLSNEPDGFQEAYRQFSEFAVSRVLPLETQAIINSARKRDIPFFQLERAPLTGCIDTGFRIRPHRLLMLGHGLNNHILDGTFCVDRAGDYLKALLRNPDQRVGLLKQLGIPALKQGANQPTGTGRYHLLVINRKVTTIAELPDGGKQVVENVHDSLLGQAVAISEKAGFAPVVITLQTRDITQPLGQADGVAIDFDLAPDLYELLNCCGEGKALLASAADDLIDWLFPDHESGRIPIVAVTGTNGKTTSVRMLRHIFHKSGYKPGMVCTDGIFLDQRQVSHDDNSTFMGHARVLTSKLVDAAVLETHHRGIAVHGFAFQHCDVGVCLNVTEEHLAEGEIETVEEMVGIKRALVERASHAAILFADDANCLGMIRHMTSDKICLVSMQSGVEELVKTAGQKVRCFCVLETTGDEEWITLYDNGQRLPVIPVFDIPATFDGTARVNVSNAMHAIAASYFSGLSIGQVRSALSTFSAGQKLTPGRLNVFDELPFRIIIDFAHNPDGIQKICAFADLQKVTGRKIIAFAGLSKRTDDINRKIAQAVVGHFDFYFCKDYEPKKPSKSRFTAPFMQQVLIEEGVPGDATTVLTWGKEAIFKIFDSCQPGDLLLLLLGYVETGTVPGYIKEYRKERAGL